MVGHLTVRAEADSWVPGPLPPGQRCVDGMCDPGRRLSSPGPDTCVVADPRHRRQDDRRAPRMAPVVPDGQPKRRDRCARRRRTPPRRRPRSCRAGPGRPGHLAGDTTPVIPRWRAVSFPATTPILIFKCGQHIPQRAQGVLGRRLAWTPTAGLRLPAASPHALLTSPRCAHARRPRQTSTTSSSRSGRTWWIDPRMEHKSRKRTGRCCNRSLERRPWWR